MQSGGSPAISTATHQASLSLVRPCSIVASPLPSTDISLASLDRCGRARLPPLRPSQTSLSASFCCTLQPPDAVWSPNAVQTTRTAHSPSNIMTRHSQPPSAAALQHLLMPRYHDLSQVQSTRLTPLATRPSSSPPTGRTGRRRGHIVAPPRSRRHMYSTCPTASRSTHWETVRLSLTHGATHSWYIQALPSCYPSLFERQSSPSRGSHSRD